MPVEEAVAGGLFRIIAWLVMEIFFNTICWAVGWCVLKIFTLGSYPNPQTKNGHVAATGLVVLMILLAVLIIYGL